METTNLTIKEIEAIRQIRNGLVHYGQTPSIRELMVKLGYKSPRSVQDIVEKLMNKGFLKKTKTDSLKLTKDTESNSRHAQTVDVPLVGTVSCGTPIYAEENIEAMIPVSTSLAKTTSKYFILRAIGDSMDLAGIDEGDLVLVRRQESADNGEKVVALIDEEATIKEFYKTNEVVVLKPKSSNPDNKPIILTEDFRIQGVVTAVIPNF